MFISPKPLLSITVLVLSLSTLCNAQLTITRPDSLHLPKGIQYKGQLVNTAQWKDKLGDNLVILTETGIREATRQMIMVTEALLYTHCITC